MVSGPDFNLFALLKLCRFDKNEKTPQFCLLPKTIDRWWRGKRKPGAFVRNQPPLCVLENKPILPPVVYLPKIRVHYSGNFSHSFTLGKTQFLLPRLGGGFQSTTTATNTNPAPTGQQEVCSDAYSQVMSFDKITPAAIMLCITYTYYVHSHCIYIYVILNIRITWY